MDNLSELLPTIAGRTERKPASRIQQRLQPPLDDTILYQHSVLCQTMLPYRDPGDDVRTWLRRNGTVSLCIEAGHVVTQGRKEALEVGLPFGPKARLVFCHLNTQAIQTQSPVLELEDSLTKFISHTLGLTTDGRTVRGVKDQLTRLAAAHFLFGMGNLNLKTDVIQGFELWQASHAQQRMLWPTRVIFSPRYFDSLLSHAVPLNEAALGALSHSAMGLDIYTWLAQRLHRVDQGKPAFVPWSALQSQFGDGYDRIRDFRRKFLRTLGQVQLVYPEANCSADDAGLTLRNSPPPVQRYHRLK